MPGLLDFYMAASLQVKEYKNNGGILSTRKKTSDKF